MFQIRVKRLRSVYFCHVCRNVGVVVDVVVNVGSEFDIVVVVNIVVPMSVVQ